MALDEPGTVTTGVSEGREDTTGVTDRDHDGCGDGLLERATGVVGNPGHGEGDERIDTAGSDEQCGVLSADVRGGQKDDVSESAEERESDDENTTTLQLVRQVSNSDRNNGGTGIGGNCHISDSLLASPAPKK